MVKDIVHDTFILSMKSSDATIDDISVANDLLDTLKYHKDRCVGMAANMIGVHKRILVLICNDNSYLTLINPIIIKKENRYETKEGCLSLEGEPRKCIRFNKIKVQYQTLDFKVRIKTFEGFEAQIIQHEMDHFEGILI